jgi:3-hydroxybutyryl-CoA dehydrogenase
VSSESHAVIHPPRTVAVCGLGQMGLPLSLACWRSGYRVLLYDQDGAKVERAPQGLQEMDSWLTRQLPELESHYGELHSASDPSFLTRESDLIIECILEDMAAKAGFLQGFADAAARGAIFCTCTSGLSITEIGRRAGFPTQVVGTHFWSPPHLMPLVEVVRGSETADETIEIAAQFCRSLGKHPVRVNVDVPGFIGNRMLHALWREAINIVERGIASPEDVDTVAKFTIGLRQAALGPLEHMDLAGLDLIRSIHAYLLQDLAANSKPSPLLQQMVNDRRLGMKTGRGFHDWGRRDPAALIEARDRQIVRELKRLKRDGEFPGPIPRENR